MRNEYRCHYCGLGMVTDLRRRCLTCKPEGASGKRCRARTILNPFPDCPGLVVKDEGCTLKDYHWQDRF